MSNHNGNANKMVGEAVSDTPTTGVAQATPDGELRRQILSQCVAKNEREWWAARMIEKLEFELNAANERIKELEEEVQELKVVNEYAWQKNGKLNDRIRHLIRLGLETSQYGLTKYREQWEQEEEL